MTRSNLISLLCCLLASYHTMMAQPQDSTLNASDESSGKTVAGILGGNFSINKGGSMNYHVAIEVPPGTNGMAPKLAISYSSNASNGYLGQGWTLQGLHKIERVAATIAQDGFWGTVNFGATARYAINGQRLMLDQQFDKDSCWYRTEIESWSKITSYGSFSDPDSFRIITKKGMAFTYGTNDSTLVTTNDGCANWEWLLASESDLHQNSIEYTYLIDNANSVSYPYRIDYTSGKDLVAQRHVHFNYETRPDTVTSFSSGNMQRYLSLLSSIQTEVSDTLALQYQITYENSAITGKSLLKKITKCDKNNYCFPANRFRWQQPTANYPDSVTTYQQSAIPTGISLNTIGDLNADGISDLVNIWPDNYQLNCAITLGSHQGLTTKTKFYATDLSYPGLDSIPPILTDINGDGADQIVYPFAVKTSENEFEIAMLTLSYSPTADTLVTSDTIMTGLYAGSYYFQSADINGDGNGDLIFFTSDDTETYLTYNIGLSDGTSFQFAQKTTTLNAPWIVPPNQLTFTSNINGDPMNDLYYCGSNGNGQYLSVYYIIAANDTTLQVADTLSTDLPTDYSHIFPVDLNGDNLTDLVHTFLIEDDTIAIIPLTGTGEGLADLDISTRFANPLATILPADVNGDHFTDLLVSWTDTDGKVQITPYISSGNSYTATDTLSPASLPAYNLDLIPADMNGDAKADLIALEISTASTVAINALPSITVFPDLISEADNGVGGSYQINYAPLTDHTLYSTSTAGNQSQPGIAFFNFSNGARFPAGSNSTIYGYGNSNGISNGAFPVQEVDIPIYVVSSYSQSSQVGDYYAYGLQYSNAEIDRNGRGWLGFEQKILADSSQQSYSQTRYLQNFPSTGTTDTSAVFKMGHNEIMVQKRFRYTDSVATTGAGYKVHHLRKATSRSDYYHKGEWAYTLGINYQYDPFDNISVIKNLSDTTKDNTVYTLHQFINDTVNWRIGYLSSAQKSSDSSGKDTLSFTQYQYDDQFNLILKQDWDDAQQTFVNNQFGYDDYGNITSHTSQAGDITKFTFDKTYQTFNIAKTSPLLTDPNGNTYQLTYRYEYDTRFGALTGYENPNQQKWQFQLDNFGRDTLMLGPDPLNPDNPPVHLLSSVRDFDNHNFMYLESRQLLSWGTTNYLTTRSKLDGLGRIFRKQKVSDNKTIGTDYHYDNKNRIIAKSLPYQTGKKQYATTGYDHLGRVIRKTFPFLNGDSIVHEVQYNKLSKKKTTYKAVGTAQADTLHYYYDYFQSQRKITKVVDQAKGVTTHERDLLGREIQVIDPANNKNNIAISTLNRATSTNDGSFNDTQYQYIDSLRIRYVINQDMDTVLFAYDPLNRISTMKWSASDSIVSAYDATGAPYGLGKTATVTLPDGDTYQYTYDAYGNAKDINFIIGGSSFNSQYQFSPTDKLSQLIYPDGTRADLSYSGLDYLSTVQYTDSATIQMASYTSHNVFGSPKTVKYGNGTSLISSFYDDGSPESLYLYGKGISSNADTTLIQQTYSWDYLRRIAAINDLSTMNLTQKFGYDPLSRLLSATGQYGDKTYAYDPSGNGNLTLKDDIIYQYDGNQVISGVSQSSQQQTVFTASYDTNGNRTSAVNNGTSFSYTFNELDQLTDISKNQVPSSSMAYNHKGIRYQKLDLINQLTTCYVSPYYTVINDEQGNVIQTKYIPGLNTIATVTETLQGNFGSKANGTPQPGTLYLYQDHLNSTSVTTNTAGQLATALFYEPHGTPYAITGPDDLINKFQDKPLDEESGLYYFDARYYDPNTGSFISADPMLSGITDRYNRYAFTANNPINLIDPTGHQSGDWIVSVLFDAAEIILGTTISISGVSNPIGSAFTSAGVSGLVYGLKNKQNFSWEEWGKTEGISVASGLVTAAAEGIGSMIKNTTELTSDEVAAVRQLIGGNNEAGSGEEDNDATTKTHKDSPSEGSSPIRSNSLPTMSLIVALDEDISSNSAQSTSNSRQYPLEEEEITVENSDDVMHRQSTQIHHDVHQNVLNKTSEITQLQHKAAQSIGVTRNDKATMSRIRYLDQQVNIAPGAIRGKKSKPGKSEFRKYKHWLLKSN